MTATNIIFLDIITVLPAPFSPNTWKVRLALNYKKLAYETRWVETTDIASVCKALGIPPTSTLPDGTPKYTLPALVDNNPSPPALLSDSTPIIEYLERTYPDPDSSRALCPPISRALLALFEYHVAHSITAQLLPVMVMHMYDKKTPRDRIHFRKRTEAAFGKKLEDIELRGKEREEHWNKIEGAFDLLATFMQAGGGASELFTGSNLSLADCTLGGLLLAFRYISPDEAWIKVSSWNNGKWVRYVAALEEWTDVV
ncbi:glutathione S-transferase [Suillus clintonianus]|uniref:glutathione S-transferase n=1 Tax=Suillus clintonianus TaxID=1904413 RepID=UPI001B86B9B9|nr:glutathione S-transferase [Suillus clintonianus]KAG2144496.1 glutathione S-transferase [Suillus clintonianus]